jgi:hypothetical protein
MDREPAISELIVPLRPLPLVARAVDMSFAVRSRTTDGRGLSLQVDAARMMQYEDAWLAIAAFASGKSTGYLARELDGQLIASSFYSQATIDFPGRRRAKDDGRIAPTTALKIEVNSVVGMYYVSSYRLESASLSPACVDRTTYREFSAREQVDLVPCVVTPRVKRWWDGVREHVTGESLDVHCTEPIAGFNWLILPAETSLISRYRPGLGSVYYDRWGHRHRREKALAEPFYFIVNLNITTTNEDESTE